MNTVVLILQLFLASQNVRTGTWELDGVIITRPIETLQIEIRDGVADTCEIKWISNTRYNIIKPGKDVLMVRIDTRSAKGYKGVITNGNPRSKKYFNMIKK